MSSFFESPSIFFWGDCLHFWCRFIFRVVFIFGVFSIFGVVFIFGLFQLLGLSLFLGLSSFLRSKCGIGQFSLPMFVKDSCFSRYVGLLELINLNDLLDNGQIWCVNTHGNLHTQDYWHFAPGSALCSHGKNLKNDCSCKLIFPLSRLGLEIGMHLSTWEGFLEWRSFKYSYFL